MTASRARSSDIGSERENSRIGTRWGSALARPALALAGLVAAGREEFFRVIIMIRKKVQKNERRVAAPAMRLFLHCSKQQ
ncbi:MAG: hypothetical protein ABI192_07095 [Bradyrhizobium sp.]